jgi:hypothetical protein
VKVIAFYLQFYSCTLRVERFVLRALIRNYNPYKLNRILVSKALLT